MNDRGHEREHAPVKAGTYVRVWLGLLVLTGITVGIANLHLGRLSILGALLIASIKSTLVLLYFMHLRYEPRMFAAIFLTTIAVLTIFIGLTFCDIAFR